MKILVGYDGSNAAKDAMELALKSAQAFQATVSVVTSMVKGTEENQNEIEQAERGLEYAQSFFEKSNIGCKTHLLIRGMSPGEDLVKFAQDNSIHQVFVGVKRRSKVGKLLMGSTAQYVILNAPCPVMTIK
jgi:nucleotide-binding universal stress UspA family protein